MVAVLVPGGPILGGTKFGVTDTFLHSVPGLQVYRLMNDIPSALADLEKAIELSGGKCSILCVDLLTRRHRIG